MWFALASVDTNLKEAASHMAPAQVAEAQRMAQDWVSQHATKREEIASVPEMTR